MPQKPHVVDYESVMRTGFAVDPAEGNSDDWIEQPAPLLPQKPTVAKFGAVKQTLPPVAEASQSRNTIIKRGHALSFVGLMLFTALVYLRPYEIFPSFKWTASGAFWIALATLLVYMPTQLGLEGRVTTPLKQINLLLFLLFTGLLSVPFATDRSMAWAGFIEFVKVVLIFIMLVNVLRTETRLRLLIMLILVVSCWMSIAAINDYRLGRFLLPGARIEGIIGGLFDNPNDMALHLVTMIPIAAAFFLTSRHLPGKLIYPVCVALMVAGIVASFSRGGFLGLICATGYMVWRLSRSKRVLFLAIALVLCAGFVALAPGDFRERIATTGDSSSIQRQNDLKRSLFVLVHHPVLGVGINNYVLFSNTDHATHNAYTQIGAEMGVPAMLIYMMFLLAGVKPLRQIGLETSQQDPKSRFRYLAAGFEASLIGYMVASFFASVAYLWYLYYLVAYGLCLARLYHEAQAKALLKNAGNGQPDRTGYTLARETTANLSPG
jgi:putative inorganic carbon (HCO3(-)) transporter